MPDNNETGPDSYHQKNRQRPRMKHFEVSPYVHCKLDFDFALALGQLLLEVETDDKRFKSFGHHLCNLEDDEQN